MSVYRGEGVRLKKETSQNLINTCYPGPDETVMGKYARMRPQLPYFHAFDKAHLVMLVEQGLVPVADIQIRHLFLFRLISSGIRMFHNRIYDNGRGCVGSTDSRFRKIALIGVLLQTDQDAWDSVLSVALNNIFPGSLCMKSPCGNKILR